MPQDPLKQTLMDRAATPARGTKFIPPYHKKWIIGEKEWEDYNEQAYDKFHPNDIPEGILENLIKGIGRKLPILANHDYPFLEQFLHPEKDILPKRPLRPKYTQIPEGMDVRGLPTTESGMPDLIYIDGLGRYTSSRTPEYNSIYDIWQIDDPEDTRLPQPFSGLAKVLLNQVGKPFVVYERFEK